MLSEDDMLTDNIETIIYNGVGTISGKYRILKGIGTVSWSCTDNEVQLQTNKLNNLIYFTD